MKNKRFTIGQVSEITGLAPHVLRFWETAFEELQPERTAAGARLYREEDIALILRIKHLLHEERYTIEGAKRVLLKEREKTLSPLQKEMMELRAFLVRLLEQVDSSTH